VPTGHKRKCWIFAESIERVIEFTSTLSILFETNKTSTIQALGAVWKILKQWRSTFLDMWGPDFQVEL
jgi:hypothetical protein